MYEDKKPFLKLRTYAARQETFMHPPKSFVVDKKKKQDPTTSTPSFLKRHNIQILTKEQAIVVLWPGRASGIVFGCGAAGSML